MVTSGAFGSLMAVTSLLMIGSLVGGTHVRFRHLEANSNSKDTDDHKKEDTTCQQVFPPDDDEFELDKYIQRSWFVQKQQVTPYQSENDLFCVTATYNARTNSLVQVLNYGRRGSVTGQEIIPATSGIGELCAQQTFGAKLRVGPCLLSLAASVVYGPYWIVALGIDEIGDDYDWAIISAGNPDIFIERKDNRNFCTTTNSTCFLDTNGSGLWFFTRKRVADAATIAIMEAKLNELGIYAGGLKNIPHQGCVYPDFIKI